MPTSTFATETHVYYNSSNSDLWYFRTHSHYCTTNDCLSHNVRRRHHIQAAITTTFGFSTRPSYCSPRKSQRHSLIGTSRRRRQWSCDGNFSWQSTAVRSERKRYVRGTPTTRFLSPHQSRYASFRLTDSGTLSPSLSSTLRRRRRHTIRFPSPHNLHEHATRYSYYRIPHAIFLCTCRTGSLLKIAKGIKDSLPKRRGTYRKKSLPLMVWNKKGTGSRI